MKKMIVLFAFLLGAGLFYACEDQSTEIDQSIELNNVSPAEDEDEKSPGHGGG